MASRTPPLLVVGTTGDYAPFSLRTDAGLVGLDIDLAQAIGRRLGRGVRFAGIRWTSLGAALADEALDFVASGLTVSAERARLGTFTRPYAHNATVVVVPRDAFLREGTIESALAQRRLGVNHGGYLERTARARFPHAIITTVTDNRSLPLQLLAGAYDAFMSDALEAERFASHYPVRIAAELEAQQHALFFSRGREELCREIDALLGEWEDDGTLGALRARHGVQRRAG